MRTESFLPIQSLPSSEGGKKAVVLDLSGNRRCEVEVDSAEDGHGWLGGLAASQEYISTSEAIYRYGADGIPVPVVDAASVAVSEGFDSCSFSGMAPDGSVLVSGSRKTADGKKTMSGRYSPATMGWVGNTVLGASYPGKDEFRENSFEGVSSLSFDEEVPELRAVNGASGLFGADSGWIVEPTPYPMRHYVGSLWVIGEGELPRLNGPAFSDEASGVIGS